MKCALCDLNLSDYSTKKILDLFNLHRKCRKELEMAQCACGNQDLTYKTGTSKKTGKKWQGWKCEPCDLMMGMNGVPWGARASPPPQNGPKTSPIASSLEAKVDRILAILKNNFPDPKNKLEVMPELENEETPF